MAFLTVFTALLIAAAYPGPQGLIVDSSLTLEQAVEGTTAPANIIASLCITDVEYYGFDGELHRGQIVIHHELAGEVRKIFKEIRQMRFPVESVIPVRFDLPDNGTTMDTLNNTYGFHYRAVTTSGSGKLSVHSYGRAIDINPYQNPAVLSGGRVIPPGSVYDPEAPGTLTGESEIVKLFLRYGWQWGGAWSSLKDYMHFEKP